MTGRCLLLVYTILLLVSGAARLGADVISPVTDMSSAQEKYEAAHMAFERGDPEEAMRLYRQIGQSDFVTPAVWFNAGTAAYRNGDPGHAVLYYRKALRLDPGYERARESLDVVSPETNRTDDNFATLFVEGLFAQTSPGLWILFAQFFVLAFWFSVAKILASPTREKRVHWYSVLAWTFVFAVVCGSLAYTNHRYRSGGDEAVVVEDRVLTRSEPRETATAQLELPAGTILNVTEKPQNGFVRVKLVDGRTGYISTQYIEKI